MDKELLEKLKDEKFLEQVVGAKDEEKVKKIFADNGIKVSEKDVEELGKSLSGIKTGLCELSEDEFDKISGGGFTGGILKPFEAETELLKGLGVNGNVAASVSLATFVATTIGTWELGKFVVKKGKENQWFDKFKSSAVSLKDKIMKKTK